MTESQSSNNKKEWYKHGWGLLVAILFLPYFLIWYAWVKSNWSKSLKIGLTAAIAVIMLPMMIGAATTKPSETSTQQNNSVSREQSELENKQALQAEVAAKAAAQKLAEERAATAATAQKKAEEDAAAAAAIRNSESAASSTPTNSQSATSTVEPSSNLPLKAICNDGTVSYQDSPSKPNYKGMCSDHDGIKIKLDRVP